MRFEWDADKAAANVGKHGVDFAVARRVFDDPAHLVQLDPHSCVEERWQIIGAIDHVVVLFVVAAWTDDGSEEVVRIISARKATRYERRIYERGERTADGRGTGRA